MAVHQCYCDDNHSRDLTFSNLVINTKEVGRFSGKPLIAGVLNFVLPGLGYIYSAKRIIFGSLLLIGILFFSLWLVTAPHIQSDFNNTWATLSTLFIMVGFAIDGYFTAKEHKITYKHHARKK